MVRLIITADGATRADQEVGLPTDIFNLILESPDRLVKLTNVSTVSFLGGAPLGPKEIIRENPECLVAITVADPGLDLAHVLAPYLLCSKQTVADSERSVPIVEDENLPPELGDDSTKPKRGDRQPTTKPDAKPTTKLGAAALQGCPDNCLARDVQQALLNIATRAKGEALDLEDLKMVKEETGEKNMTLTAFKLNASRLITALACDCPKLTQEELVKIGQTTSDLNNWFEKNFRGRATSKDHPQLPKHALGILKVALRGLGHGKYRAA